MNATATIKGQGQAKHHFHGTYSATIGIYFGSEEEAKKALEKLGSKWIIPQQVKPLGLVANASGDELDAIIAQLVSFGAKEKKILSCAKSIDFGEKFEIEIPV